LCYPKTNFVEDITLTSRNDIADDINTRKLAQIRLPAYTFVGTISGKFNIEKKNLPSPLNLELKVGAKVMFTKNDDRKRWVNGSLGIVRFIKDDNIEVEVTSDLYSGIFEVPKVEWETYKYKYDGQSEEIIAEKIGMYTQYPLMLAWAVTIHKSQGKTLEKVMINLGTGAFDSGQTYVALSRCKTIENIKLAHPISPRDLINDPIIKRLFDTLNVV